MHNIKIHFHHQTIAVYVNWQFSQVLMVKVVQAAFAVACFWGFSDTHECSGHLQIPPYPLDKQTAGCISPHDWLMSLAMDLAVLCHPPAPCIYDTICGKYSAWEDWQIWQKRMPFANVLPIPFTINFSYTCSSFANTSPSSWPICQYLTLLKNSHVQYFHASQVNCSGLMKWVKTCISSFQ